ncbi:major facilitator transporter [Dactylosporangium vinaceum]|uniref:MFS transporter n=1 Tax=Dactylosporangium vinaceum TaxID=53362 RepID=A0ABV5MK52_9ACTN|nr:MFS transporter [Dactylosporangium vinaceum]UAC02496.1 major facilitator transporter [Dactylosporangium vinaceum]
MRVFNVLWAGQVVSLVGSSVTAFGVGIWVYASTGSPTAYTLLVLAVSLPGIVLLPMAGALVDRWDRRRAMLLSDAGTALVTLAALILLATGVFALWQLYVMAVLLSVFKAIQWPAFSALVSEIVPREQLGRANGRIGLAEAVGEVLGAVLAGSLYAVLSLRGLLLIDVLTFTAALGTMLWSLRRLPPRPPRAGAAREPLGGELSAGWRFIRARPGLSGLLTFFAVHNFGMQLVIVLVPPLVLTLSGPAAYGIVEAVGWAGMVLVGALISVTRQPRRRVRAILVVGGVHAVLVAAMGLTHSVWAVAAGMFAILGGWAVTNAVTATLWQLKTPLDVQGRVFAVRRMLAWSAQPLAYAVAGPVAQYAAAPLVDAGGPLAASLGRVTGGGIAGGIALLFLAAAPLLLGIVAVSALRPRVRLLESELPDVPGEPASPPADRAEDAQPVLATPSAV